MRFFCLLGLTVLLTGVLFTSFGESNERNRFVRVTRHQANIWTDHTNPRGEIVRQTKKGEYLELLSEGESWYRVRAQVRDADNKKSYRDGFIMARDGKVVNSKMGTTIMHILYVLILLGGAAGIVLYVKKQKNALAS